LRNSGSVIENRIGRSISIGSHKKHETHSESPRTTKLYDRTSDVITLDEAERIVI